jgi:hypothetical protein
MAGIVKRRVPAYKPARPNWAPPKRFTTPGGAKPAGYAKYGIGTSAPWGQTKKPNYGLPKTAPGLGQSLLGKPGGSWVGYEGSLGPSVPQYTPPQGAGLIGGDWEVQQAETDMASQMARKRGDFQAGLRQAFVDLGASDASKLGNLGKYIDAETIQKAIENKYSQTATIGKQAERSRAVNNAALAARGMLSSGQTTQDQADVSAAAESGRYMALRNFLGQGAGDLSSLADLESDLARNIAMARGAAAGRAAETYPEAFLGSEPLGGAYSPDSSGGGAIPSRPGAIPSPPGIPAIPKTPYRAPLRSGYKYGTKGQYMTKATFNKAKPQGNYQAYQNYLKRKRGGKL